jgi:hypothetical protein
MPGSVEKRQAKVIELHLCFIKKLSQADSVRVADIKLQSQGNQIHSFQKSVRICRTCSYLYERSAIPAGDLLLQTISQTPSDPLRASSPRVLRA